MDHLLKKGSRGSHFVGERRCFEEQKYATARSSCLGQRQNRRDCSYTLSRQGELKKRQVGMNLPPLGLQNFCGMGSANSVCAAHPDKAAYLKLTVVLKRLPSRVITSSSRQVPAQELLVFQV